MHDPGKITDVMDVPTSDDYKAVHLTTGGLSNIVKTAINDSHRSDSPTFARSVETLKRIAAIGDRAAKLLARGEQLGGSDRRNATQAGDTRKPGRLA